LSDKQLVASAAETWVVSSDMFLYTILYDCLADDENTLCLKKPDRYRHNFTNSQHLVKLFFAETLFNDVIKVFKLGFGFHIRIVNWQLNRVYPYENDE